MSREMGSKQGGGCAERNQEREEGGREGGRQKAGGMMRDDRVERVW